MIEDARWPRADAWLARDDADPALVVVGVPTSVASLSPSKAYQTPNRLRAILRRFSTFHSDSTIDLRELSVSDLGDWQVSSFGLEQYQGAIEIAARRLAKGPVHAFIGGDNGITRPLVNGLAAGKLGRVGVLTLDAHHDVRTLEQGPTNGTPIRGLIEDGLSGEQVIQVGIHAFANSLEYRTFCDEQRIRIVTMETIDAQGLVPIVGAALEGLANQCKWIYVDFDLGVLDRAFAPACPDARPGGMSPRQLATAAWICGQHPKVRAVDFVEVDASADVNDLTLMNMATAFLSFAARCSRSRIDASGMRFLRGLHPKLKYLLQVAALAVAYGGLGGLALEHVLVSGWEVAVVWPPSGVALAALLVGGFRLWPGLAIGTAFLSLGSTGLPQVALSMVGVTLEAVLGAYLLKHVLGFRNSLDRVYDVGCLAGVAGVASVVGSAIGIVSFYSAGRIPSEEVGTEWLKFWLGDAMGILTVAPFFLAWSFGPRPRGRRGEGLFVATALLLVTGLAFGGWLGREAALAVVGAFFPFLVWTALRFGVHGASLTVLGVSALSVWGTAQGHGPFVAGSFDHRMILLWGFLGVVMLTTMALAAVTEERRRARGALRESEARFRGLVEDANDIIYALSTDGVFSYVSPD